MNFNNIKFLEDSEIPVYDFNHQKYNIDFTLIKDLLKKFGIIVFKKYYSEIELKNLKNEINKFDYELNNSKTNLVENCSGDLRLFHVEKKSKILKNLVSDNILFNNIAALYKEKKYFNKKLLLNNVVFDANNNTSSGGGWHRDNHHCQFKTLVYMSDVGLKNGNFQFIVNSTQKHIGIPPHWSYNNTRYSNDTINKLLKDGNNNCKLYDIIGEAGTVVFFDATNIHRGKVIEEGSRNALTQYYFT